ncbi:hypothetical protein I547_2087 [Mycobacterium kansasii 824]|uniref:Uncharacterized protein n=1 Tax=Mycobacterium kansasii TaxID=1768 RepID=A0A1V3WRW5_MYCKA|nr:hypothetical protein I547_2087 [Mycobacterium kansasii 824]OOK68713.1 hypothetical protein BZL30_7005 [Mycobacterium kansasii]OOK69664.1 hypothetical protein BZL29_6161 [Mycobacterium kansasii]
MSSLLTPDRGRCGTIGLAPRYRASRRCGRADHRCREVD